ncbi:MAG: SUMF1/EgtB/PvdO family nonheme iron enzyme [Cyanobacteria bacterium J06635_10]
MCYPGNVWEWCEDSWHENYNGVPTDGSPVILNNEIYKLLRGGSWDTDSRYCRCAFRYSYERDYWYAFIGFRVVVASPRT